ncbi:MAG TPA: DinB family protein [Ktedonobacterales bacterium]
MDESAQVGEAALIARLAALLRQGPVDERAFGETLEESERERTGTVGDWAPKEYLGHLAFWRDRERERVEVRGRGGDGPNYSDYQPLNTESFADLSAMTWEQALARSRDSVEALVAAVEALPSGALRGLARSAQDDGGPSLLDMVINNGFVHPQTHLAEMLVGRGDRHGAQAIQRRMLDAVVALDAGPEVNAAARYNLACALAPSAPHEEPLALLRQSFAENPRLIALARQDADLDPLRDDPAFQALLADEHD